MSSNKANWKKAVKNLQLPSIHYFHDKDQSKLFREKVNFPGFPSYLIIDKEGKLVTKNAPRFSDTESLKIELNKLLNY